MSKISPLILRVCGLLLLGLGVIMQNYCITDFTLNFLVVFIAVFLLSDVKGTYDLLRDISKM